MQTAKITFHEIQVKQQQVETGDDFAQGKVSFTLSRGRKSQTFTLPVKLIVGGEYATDRIEVCAPVDSIPVPAESLYWFIDRYYREKAVNFERRANIEPAQIRIEAETVVMDGAKMIGSTEFRVTGKSTFNDTLFTVPWTQKIPLTAPYAQLDWPEK